MRRAISSVSRSTAASCAVRRSRRSRRFAPRALGLALGRLSLGALGRQRGQLRLAGLKRRARCLERRARGGLLLGRPGVFEH